MPPLKLLNNFMCKQLFPFITLETNFNNNGCLFELLCNSFSKGTIV